MSLQEKTTGERRLFIDYSDTLLHVPTNLQRNAIVFMTVKAFATPSVYPKSRDSSDKAVILLNNAKFVQASSGPHAVCLATEGGIFHSVPSPERAAFFLSCFIDTGGSGSPQCV